MTNIPVFADLRVKHHGTPQGRIDKLRDLIHHARQRAGWRKEDDTRGECSVSVNDLDTPDRCPLLGIPLRWAGNRLYGRGDSPSLDRIDNRLGYIPGNVWVVSNRANMIKNRASLEDLQVLTGALESRLKGTFWNP